MKFTGIRYGKYTVVETKAPENYLLDDTPMPFEIVEDGAAFYFEHTNVPTSGKGYVKKTSEDGIVEGFKFRVTGESNSGVKVNEVITTDENGEFNLDLYEGTYTVEEIQTPARYIKPEAKTVKIKSGKTTEIRFENKLKKGNVIIRKYNEKDQDKVVSGATFTVYQQGIVYGTLTETSKGIYEMHDIPYGSYTIRETAAPEGYLLEKGAYIIRIKEDGETVTVSNTDTDKFVETEIEGGIEVIKKDSETNEPLAGAEFTMYDKDGKVYRVGTTDEQGKLSFTEVPYGKYTIKETMAPPEYIIDTGIYPLNIETHLQVIKISNSQTDDESFRENPKLGSIELYKVDGRTREALPGAEFTLYKANGEELGEAIETVRTGDDGKATFSNVRFGKYFVVETKAPTKYAKIDGKIPFEMLEDGKVYEFTVENTEVPGYGNLKKTSEDGVLEGFKFRITGTSDTGKVVDQIVTTNQNGEFSIELLEGDYEIEEVETPDRYLVPGKKNIHITSGETTSVSFDNKLKRGHIEILKVDETTEKPLAGAEFTLYDETGTVVQVLTTGADGKVTFENVIYGEYTVVETKSPDKYDADPTPIPFSVVENGKTIKYTKVNTPTPGHGFIKKTSEDGIVEGFKFKVTGTSDTGVPFEDTVTTDENGEFTIALLEGTYEVEEIETPIRYLVPGKQTVRIESGKTTEINFENVLKRALGVSIIKRDSKTGEAIANAEFTLYTAGGEVVEVGRTDKNGNLTFSDVPYGDFYVVETEAPKGFIRDTEHYAVKVKSNNETIYVSNSLDDDDIFYNDHIEGSIKLLKVNDQTSIPLPNAEFTLYKANGEELGEVVKTVRTDKNGEATFSEVRYGSYYVVETKAPTNYAVIEDKIPFEILENGKTYEFTCEEPEIPGVGHIKKTSEDGVLEGFKFRVKGTSDSGVKVNKTVTTDENGEFNLDLYEGTYTVEEIETPIRYLVPGKQTVRVESGKTTEIKFENVLKKAGVSVIKRNSKTGEAIEGAEFTLYDSTGKKLKTLITDENGTLTFTELPYGEYKVRETKAPEGYIRDTKTYPISVENDNDTLFISNRADGFFYNKQIEGTIEIIKIDEHTRKPLAGAEFTLYKANGEDLGEAIETLRTDDKGKVTFSEVRYGKYFVAETKAPDDYELDPTPIPFSVVEDGLLIALEKENTPKSGNVEIIKESEDGIIENVKFHIYGTAANGEYIDETALTNKDGKILFEKLNIGTYTIEELDVADRYIANETQTVVVKANETAKVKFVNKLKHIPFEINKTDISTGELIPNCGFRIKDSDGNIVVEGYTDENGIAKFSLVCGDYTYQEFDAPEGYIIDEGVYSFSILPDNEIVKAEMTNVGTGTLELTKTDISTGEPIPDTSFRIKDEDGSVVREGKTDDKGIATFERLPYGKYTYEEFDAPEGYIIDETPYPFEIKENGKVVKATMTNKKRSPGYITTDDQPKTGDTTGFVVIMLILIAGVSLILVIYNVRTSKKKNSKN